MKYTHILFIFTLLATGASAQQFSLKGIRINQFSNVAVDQNLEKYEVFRIDAGQLAEAVSNQTEPFDLEFGLIANPSTIRMKPNQVVADDYVLRVGTNSGVKTRRGGPDVYTFTNAGVGEAALTLGEDFVYGLFETNGQTWFVEPLRYFDHSQADDLFVVYERSDVKQGPEVTCGAVELEKEKEQNHPEEGRTFCGPKTLQIAVASDFMMVTKYGSVSAVENHIIGLINAASANWDFEFDQPLYFSLLTQFIPSTPESDPTDPLQHSRDPLLNSFKGWANNGGFGTTSFDYGQWRSPREILNPSNQQILGATFFGQVCTFNKYSIFSDLNGYSLCAYRTNISHETGHIFGANHVVAQGSHIMVSAYSGCTNTWAPASVAEINQGIGNAACLTNLLSGTCPMPTSLPQPSVFGTLMGGQQTCYTIENICIGSFQITTPQENLLISVDGTTICMTAIEGFDWSPVLVVLLDYCGEVVSKPFYWYVSAVTPFTGDGPEERSGSVQPTDKLQVISTPSAIYVHDDGRSKSIQVCDITGRSVIRQVSSDQQVTIPVGELSPGIWVIRVESGDEVVTRLFVK